MTKYGRLQILKHAMEYYIQRSDATKDELKEEISILKQITNQLEQLKEQYHISNGVFKVTHTTGRVWEIECSGKKSAIKRAFSTYKKECPLATYDEFIQNIEVEEVK